MKIISENTYRLFFRIGVIVKAVISLGEIIAGLAFSFLSYETIHRIVFTLFGGELTESPRDIIWEYVARVFHDFSATPQSVWAFIFLSHGIVKIFLVGGLWRNKLWAYPTAAVIFALFIGYQLYQLTFTPSLFLWLITVFDIVLVILILHEYRYRRHRNTFS